MDKEVDWKKIKTEYITTSISQRKLAAKHNVSFSTLRNRANTEKWFDLKEQHRNKVITNATKRIADKQTDLLVEEFDTACKLVELIQDSTNDIENFKEKLLGMESVIVETGRIDTKAILNVASSLQKLIDIKRVCTDHQTINERQKHELELEKLALERKKAEKDDNADKEIKIVINGSDKDKIDDWSG